MKIQVGDVEYRLVAGALTWERRQGPQWVYVMDPQTSALLCALATERTACDRWRKDRGLHARSSEYQRDVLSVEHDARRTAEASQARFEPSAVCVDDECAIEDESALVDNSLSLGIGSLFGECGRAQCRAVSGQVNHGLCRSCRLAAEREACDAWRAACDQQHAYFHFDNLKRAHDARRAAEAQGGR